MIRNLLFNIAFMAAAIFIPLAFMYQVTEDFNPLTFTLLIVGWPVVAYIVYTLGKDQEDDQ